MAREGIGFTGRASAAKSNEATGPGGPATRARFVKLPDGLVRPAGTKCVAG